MELKFTISDFTLEASTNTDDQTYDAFAPPVSPMNLVVTYDGAGNVTITLNTLPILTVALTPDPASVFVSGASCNDPGDYVAITTMQISQP
jgi:hypothetical protein